LVNSIRPEDTVYVNGDDAAVDRECECLPFPNSPWEFKSINGPRVEFSGFEVGGPEPEYSAKGIQYRAWILESRDPSAQDKWVNYLDLLQYSDPEAPEAIEVARKASYYLPRSKFVEFLPPRFRSYFPRLFSEVFPHRVL
jgi:hypothetical protein